GAGVDDVPDAGHRETRLGDVRREDDATAHTGDGGPLEHPVLLGGGKPSVEREDLGGRSILRVHATHGIRGIPDLRLAGEEHEDVTRRLAVELAERAEDAVDVVSVGFAVL